MFDYHHMINNYGKTVKEMVGPMMVNSEYRKTFETLVDANLAFNRAVFEAGKEYVNTLGENVNKVASASIFNYK